MIQKVILFLIISIGIILSPNSVSACSKTEAKKELSACVNHNLIKSTKSNCCENDSKGNGHDCGKKCKDHNCDSNTMSNLPFFNKKNQTELVIFDFSIQKPFSLYQSSFYNEVYISIWHPPKIG